MELKKAIQVAFELYGLRNAMFARGDMRALWLHERIDSLWKCIRREETDKKVLEATLASLFARALAFADSFIDLSFVEAMCEKYPMAGCAYCGGMPCECSSSKRRDVTIACVSPKQSAWTISKWVEHMGAVYGTSNKQRGIQYAMLRLIEEVHEVEKAHHFEGVAESISLTERRLRLAREFADVLAWIFAIAHMLQLDLEAEVVHRYGGPCVTCGKRPCDCGSPFIPRAKVSPIDRPETVVC